MADWVHLLSALQWNPLVGGRAIVQDNAIPGLDLADLGRQARAAVAKIVGAGA